MALTEVDNSDIDEDGAGESQDVIAKASVLDGFSESGETRALIASLPEVHGDIVTRESVTERFIGESTCRVTFGECSQVVMTNLEFIVGVHYRHIVGLHYRQIADLGNTSMSMLPTLIRFSPLIISVIMDRYQEQPHLLDPHLGNTLITMIK